MSNKIDLKLDGDNTEAPKFIVAVLLKEWNKSITVGEATLIAERFAGPVSRLLKLSSPRLAEELDLRTAELLEPYMEVHRNSLPKDPVYIILIFHIILV